MILMDLFCEVQFMEKLQNLKYLIHILQSYNPMNSNCEKQLPLLMVIQ